MAPHAAAVPLPVQEGSLEELAAQVQGEGVEQRECVKQEEGHGQMEPGQAQGQGEGVNGKPPELPVEPSSSVRRHGAPAKQSTGGSGGTTVKLVQTERRASGRIGPLLPPPQNVTFAPRLIPLALQPRAVLAHSYAFHSLLTTHYPLPTTHGSLPTTHYSPLTTHYSLLTTHYSLHYPPPTTHYSLLTAPCSLYLRFTVVSAELIMHPN